MVFNDSELKWNEVLSALTNLSLTYVTIGDYVIIMNNQIDATIGGEPYLALQLWLNMKSGKIISRIWDQTVAFGKAINVAHLSEACVTHFKGRPCIGYPVFVDEHSEQDFIISQTPVPRKISRTCEKTFSPSAKSAVLSCTQCLKLREFEMPEDEESSIKEKIIKRHGQEIGEMEVLKNTVKYESPQDTNQTTIQCYKKKCAKTVKGQVQGKGWQNTFTCEFCGKKTGSQVRYERHRLLHTGNAMHMDCEVCGERVALKNFRSHMMKHGMKENEVKKKQCNWCENKYSPSNWHYHAMRKHFYGNFVCQKCPFVCSFAKDLVCHIKEDHTEDEKTKCPCCSKEQFLNNLESHYKGCVTSKLNSEDKKSPQVCPTCGKTVCKSFLKNHMKTHLREQAQNGGESSLNDNLYHYCDKCDKKFRSSGGLLDHIQSVHEKHKFNCSKCSGAFSTRRALKKHNIIVHSTDKKYQCRFCGARKCSVTEVKIHERVHEDPQFQCSFCAKKLKCPAALQEHERQHTGEKPFKCSVCASDFASSKALLQHTRGVHKIVGPHGGKTGWTSKSDKNKKE